MISAAQASTLLQGMVGKPAWGVALGEGSFVTLELGGPQPAKGRGKPHGEWHVWVYGCAWRIDGPNGALGGSLDEEDVMAKAIAALDGKTLNKFSIESNLEATLEFGDHQLRLFPSGGTMEHYMVFYPGGRVVTAGPGNQLVDEAA
jgi:hypothetical protein